MSTNPIPYQAIIIATDHQRGAMDIPYHFSRAITELPQSRSVKIRFPDVHRPEAENVGYWMHAIENAPANWLFFQVNHLSRLLPQGEGWLPFPDTAFIVTAVNPNQSMPNRDTFLLEQQNYIGKMSNLISFTTDADMLVVCLRDHNETESCFDTSDDEWWQYPNIDELNLTPEVREFQRTNIGPRIKLLNCHIDDLSELPHRLTTVINAPIEDSLPMDRFVIRGLENAEIQHKSLGVSEEASIQFVRDVIKSLVPKKVAFRIWLAYKRHPIYDGNLDHANTEERLRDQYYSLYYGKTLLSVPTVTITPYGLRVGRYAHHAYIEYAGMVFDSFIAFNRPILFEEYQTNLSYHTRGSIDISADMSLENADNVFEDLLVSEFYNPR